MAILQNSCCGCCTVRKGSIVVANIWMIMQFAGIGTAIKDIIDAGGAASTTDIVNLAIYSVGIIIDTLLIYGVVKKLKELVLSWVIFSVACTAAALGVNLYVTIVILQVLQVTGDDDGSALVQAILVPYLAGVWVVWGIVFIITVYGCLVVYSHYQNLRDGVEEGGQQVMVMTAQAPPPGPVPGAAVQSF